MGRSGGDGQHGGNPLPGDEPPPAELWIDAGSADAPGGDAPHPGGPTPGSGGSGRRRWIALVVGFVVLVAVIAVQHYASGRSTAGSGTVASSRSSVETTPAPADATATRAASSTESPGTSTSAAVGPNVPRESLEAAQSRAAAEASSARQAAAEARSTTAQDAVGHPTNSPITSSVRAPALPDAGDWELVGYGPQGVVRYRPSTGRIVVTPMADITANGPPAFAVTATSAFVGSPGNSARYLVPDGQPARVITDVDGPIQTVLPGPDPDHVWAVASDGASGALTLLNSAGSGTGRTVPIPAGLGASAWFQVTSDGAGYVLAVGIGGTYDVRPGSTTLVTHGRVLAAGPTALLVYECDEHARCGTVVIDRTTGKRRPGPTLDPANLDYIAQGVISPDGRYVALLGMGISLYDLRTDERSAVVPLQSFAVGGDASTMFTFSPDGRYLLIATPGRGVVPVDTATGAALDPLPIPPVTVLAVRPAG